MLPEFLDLKTIYLIIHVFGAILGAGGAFLSDVMFFSTIKDGVINKDELRFMKIGGAVVWVGLLILIISGILIFYTNPDFYANSQKFLVKLSIVLIIVVNGIVFHKIHLPHLKKHLGVHFRTSKSFKSKASFVIISGVVSMVSWVATVVLGMLKKVPYTYSEIFYVYLIILFLGILFALITKNKLLKLR